MKKNVLLVVLMITIATIMVGCGNKNTEKTTENNEVVESVTTETTQEVEETTEEPITEEPVEEEVIGDVDIAADGLTMADMTEQVIGLDIPVYVAEDGSNVAYDGKNFTLLFPSPMYVTEYTDTGVRAQTEAVDFVLSVMSNFSDAPESVNETRNEVKEVIGNYVIVSRLAKNTDNAFIKTYNIYNTVDGTSIQMTLTINKEDEYLDYDNTLIKQYIPAFENSIKNNLQ